MSSLSDIEQIPSHQTYEEDATSSRAGQLLRIGQLLRQIDELRHQMRLTREAYTAQEERLVGLTATLQSVCPHPEWTPDPPMYQTPTTYYCAMCQKSRY